MERSKQHPLAHGDSEIRVNSGIQVIRVPYQGEVGQFEMTEWGVRTGKKQPELPKKAAGKPQQGLSDSDCRKLVDALMLTKREQVTKFLEDVAAAGVIPRLMVSRWLTL